MRKLNSSGFSMIELTIVVAIASILGSVAVPNFKAMQDKATITMAKGQMAQMNIAVATIHMNRKTLREVGTYCTGCEQGWQPHTNPNTWPGISGAVGNKSWKAMGFQEVPKDPWGHYYVIDENDEEQNFNEDTGLSEDYRYDAVWSAGPDGIWDGMGDGDDVYGDDLIWRLPMKNPSRCPAAHPDTSAQFGASRCKQQDSGHGSGG